ncbi:hypothetical protein OG21DRAFT_1525435 [Imleria badia]|nr:hypothetical protein OG21DRAFT_1525435 [Imleria badia]
MQFSSNSYPAELMEKFRTLASCFGSTSRPKYEIVHDWHPWIQIPRGHLPIELIQFAPDNCPNARIRDYQWAIFVPSWGCGVGNYYQVGGNQETGYLTQHIVDKLHPKFFEQKGAHLVGWVHPHYVEVLEKHFASVPIQKRSSDWIGQTWVVEALRGLNEPYLYAVQMDHDQLVRQMKIVAHAWDEGMRERGCLVESATEDGV